MANWAHVWITLDRLVTREEATELSRRLWDSFTDDNRPLPVGWTDHEGGVHFGRDGCLSFGRPFRGTEVTATLGIHTMLHEIGSYDGERAIYSIDGLLSLWRHITEIEPGCTLMLSGDGDWTHHEVIDEDNVDQLLKMRQGFIDQLERPDELRAEQEHLDEQTMAELENELGIMPSIDPALMSVGRVIAHLDGPEDLSYLRETCDAAIDGSTMFELESTAVPIMPSIDPALLDEIRQINVENELGIEYGYERPDRRVALRTFRTAVQSVISAAEGRGEEPPPIVQEDGKELDARWAVAAVDYLLRHEDAKASAPTAAKPVDPADQLRDG